MFGLPAIALAKAGRGTVPSAESDGGFLSSPKEGQRIHGVSVFARKHSVDRLPVLGHNMNIGLSDIQAVHNAKKNKD